MPAFVKSSVRSCGIRLADGTTVCPRDAKKSTKAARSSSAERGGMGKGYRPPGLRPARPSGSGVRPGWTAEQLRLALVHRGAPLVDGRGELVTPRLRGDGDAVRERTRVVAVEPPTDSAGGGDRRADPEPEAHGEPGGALQHQPLPSRRSRRRPPLEPDRTRGDGSPVRRAKAR